MCVIWEVIMAIPFEELWEQCEQFQQTTAGDQSVQSLLDELVLKINLYKALDSKESELPEQDRLHIKTRTLGEIMLSLTGISAKDNINTYQALALALQHRNIRHLEQKHPI